MSGRWSLVKNILFISTTTTIIIIIIIVSDCSAESSLKWNLVGTTIPPTFDFSLSQTHSHAYLFGGVNNKFKLQNTLLQYDFNSKQVRNLSSEGSPSRRKESSGFICGKRATTYIIVGGTLANKSISDEIWSFDLRSETWRELEGIPGGITRRTGQYGTCVSESQRFIMFGGENVEGSFLNDLVLFDGVNGSSGWSVLEIKSNARPKPRKYASVTYIPVYRNDSLVVEDSVVVFGGLFEDKSVSNELWQFTLTNNHWNLLSNNSKIPPRNANSLIYCPITHSIVVFGGESSSVDGMNDLWTFKISDGTWSQMDAINSPIKRLGSGIIIISEKPSFTFSVIGGVTGWRSNTTVLSDIWEFTLVEGNGKYWRVARIALPIISLSLVLVLVIVLLIGSTVYYMNYQKSRALDDMEEQLIWSETIKNSL